MQVIHHDLYVFVLDEVPYIMVKKTSLGNLKCWPLWDVDDNLISFLAVVGHKVIFWTRPRYRMLTIPFGLYQTVLEYPGRSPILLVCVTNVLQWTRRFFSIGSISDIWEVFSIDECFSCWLVFNKAPILIHSGLCWVSQDGIAHVHYAGVTPFHPVVGRYIMWDL